MRTIDQKPLDGSCARLLAVIVAYNSDAVLGRAVDALALAAADLKQSRGITTSLVLVDNASRVPVTERRDDLDLTIIRLDENLGFAPAANIGARNESSRLVLFLNPDTQLERTALTQLFGAFDEPTTAVAGPLLVGREGSPVISERPFHSFAREVRTQLYPYRKRPPFGKKQYDSGRGRCLTGACLMVERKFFESVDGFDAAIRMYLEDVELCWRAHEAGRTVRFVSAARCSHGLGEGSGGANFATRLDLHLTLLAARVEFVRRRSGVIAARGMRLVIAFGAAGRAVAVALRRGAWQTHTAVVRWALRDGRAPAWESISSVG